jgi:hypothetical protein
MDFDEHKTLREFDLDMMEKRFKAKEKYSKVIHGMKLEILTTKDKIDDKRHSQRIEAMQKGFDFYVKRFEVKDGIKHE